MEGKKGIEFFHPFYPFPPFPSKKMISFPTSEISEPRILYLKGDTMFGIGIMGAGRVIGSHLRAVSNVEQVRLLAIAEKDPQKLANFVRQNQCEGYSDYRELLQHEGIDIVINCLPHFLHCESAVAALEAGKHVLIEKPMAMTVDECDRMIEAAKRNNVKLAIGHMHHFIPVNQTAKRILASGELGDVIMATDLWYKPHLPEHRPAWMLDRQYGGGMWWMNGPHLIDRVAWLIDSPVVSVKAMIESRIYDFPSDDSAMVLLHFESGAYATIAHAWYRRGAPSWESEYVCTEGMMKFSDGRLLISKGEKYEPVPIDSSGDMFTQQLATFVDTVKNDSEYPVTLEHARNVVRLLLAAEESSKTGREVILN